ncbi:hypothetical protein NDA10_000970 [Ustilago hordei]|nr:hypothetical protein NDA10_000970 [Ustilago hordei]
MSHIKQTQQTNNRVAKAPQLTSRPPRLGGTEVRSRPPAQIVSRSVSTRTDSKQAAGTVSVIKSVSPRLQPDSASILKRSLSKLRLKDAISPSKQKPAQTQRDAQKQHSAPGQRAALQPTSKIPQVSAPASSTRILGACAEQPGRINEALSPAYATQTHLTRQDHLQYDANRQRVQLERRNDNTLHPAVPVKKHSPAADKKMADVRLKAMQLGIFKINEPDLKERYQFLNEIGAGEWGSVWSVEALRPLDHLPTSAYRKLQVVKLTGTGTYTVDNSANFRPLAVKLCKRETKYSAAARTQRLWNEFKILRTLMDQLPRAEQVNPNSPNCRVRNDRTGWHPNVVNFYEFLLTPTLAMFVMPKFDEPMKVCLGDALCRNYFQQLLSAVHWLHQHCVCHNDIKVDNLGVTYDTSGLGRDTVTLFDFGFANRYDPLEEGAFMSKDVWGTPEYLAPERCRATLHDERKTDIWALGITFFEMLTGRTPFEHHDEKFDSKEKFQEYYARAERGTWLGTWDMTFEMEDLIRKMLCHDPAERIDAAGALLHTQFDPSNADKCDSFDELLQLSYEDARTHQTAEAMMQEPDPIPFLEEVDDSDAMIEDLVAQTERLESRHYSTADAESLPPSPGVSRAAVTIRASMVPNSPSLSQVGMDSRLTDLMCVSPPWRGGQPPRQGTPIPSAQRNRILTQSLQEEAEDDQEDDSDNSIIEHPSPAAITRASRISPTKPIMVALPSKQSPFRLRIGERTRKMHLTQTVDEQMASTPVPAPAATAQRPLAPVMCPMSLPQVEDERPKPVQAPRTEGGARGNVVASLAKKFDASNFLSRPPPHITALAGQTGLGLTFRGQPAGAKLGQGHRRSKSYTLTTSQHGVTRRSVRRSTGSYVPSPEDAMPRCARRLFEAEEIKGGTAGPAHQPPPSDLDSATDIGSARSDTKNAGVDLANTSERNSVARAPALHSVLAGDQAESSTRSDSNKRLRSPPTHCLHSSTHVSSPGEEVIFKRLKKMASLAGLLTKMIDETKSTIMTPARARGDVGLIKTPVRQRGSDSTISTTAMDISPGLLETPPSEGRAAERHEEDADVSMVSAAFSLDLSGSARRDGPEASSNAHPRSDLGVEQGSPQQLQRHIKLFDHTTPTSAISGRAPITGPSSAQVETMYSSFLLSQNVCKSGSGFLSPTQPSASLNTSSSITSSKPRSLAALFAPPPTLPAFDHLMREVSPRKLQTPLAARASSTRQEKQKSVSTSGKLARLFRKQA